MLPEEPRLPLPFCARRPCSRLPRLVLFVEPAVDEGPNQGAGRDTASEALAAQACVDAFFEAHRDRFSQGSHLRPQPYTSRPPPAADRSVVWCSSAGTPKSCSQHRGPPRDIRAVASIPRAPSQRSVWTRLYRMRPRAYPSRDPSSDRQARCLSAVPKARANASSVRLPPPETYLPTRALPSRAPRSRVPRLHRRKQPPATGGVKVVSKCSSSHHAARPDSAISVYLC